MKRKPVTGVELQNSGSTERSVIMSMFSSATVRLVHVEGVWGIDLQGATYACDVDYGVRDAAATQMDISAIVALSEQWAQEKLSRAMLTE